MNDPSAIEQYDRRVLATLRDNLAEVGLPDELVAEIANLVSAAQNSEKSQAEETRAVELIRAPQ